MLEILDIRILLLIFSFLTNTKSTKMLSGQKKCGDPECETSMSRVLAIKDYTGADCRYLNFKTGEEIMVYFKLSRKREDLWAGSKGTDFGFFSMDAVQTEEVFITNEVEVPTKETDFLCIDGGEFAFENDDSILNYHDEENEYMTPHRDEKDSEFNIPEDEVQKPTGITFTKEYKETFLDNYEFYSKSYDQNTLETTSHGDSKIRESKTGQGETIALEDQISQTLKPAPTKSTWTVSGIAGWFGLKSKENEAVAREISQTTEEITFRRRKIAIIDDSDLKKLNEEGEIETRTPSWFQSTLTDMLHFGSAKSGLGLLHNEHYPEIHESSTSARSADHQSSNTVSERRKEGESDSEQSKSNWFDLELSDILTFGYAKENEIKEMFSGGELADQEEAPPFSGTQSTLMDEGLRKQADESVHCKEKDKEKCVKDTPVESKLCEEQGKYDKETPNHIIKSTFHEEQHKEKCDQEPPGTDIKKAKEHRDFDAAASSFSIELVDEILKSPYAAESGSGNKVMENVNVKSIMKESERTNDQSGWYESLYSSIIDFNRDTPDNPPGHESVTIQSSGESLVDQLPLSQSTDQVYDLTDIHTAREENQESFFSISYFTHVLNLQGLVSKGNRNIQDVQKDVLFSEESIQLKKGNEVSPTDKESEKLPNQNFIEKVSEKRCVDSSQENVLISSLAGKNNEESRDTTQDSEMAKDNVLLIKSKLEHRFSYDQCIQIMEYRKTKDCISQSLEIQGHSSIEDKNIVHILEAKQPIPLVLVDSLHQKVYTYENLYTCKKPAQMKERYDEKAVGPDRIEEINNSLLQVSEMYLEGKSKREMTERMDDEESSLVTHKKTLKEHSDNFVQSQANPGEDEIILNVSGENNLVIQGTKEQMLSEKNEVMENNEVEEIARKPDGKNSQLDFNKHSSTHTTDVKGNMFHNQEEEEGDCQHGQNADQFPFSSSSSQDRDLTEPSPTWIMLAQDYGNWSPKDMEGTSFGKANLRYATNSEEKPSKFEEHQCLFSFSHYKCLLSFQSCTDKAVQTKNYLQRISSKDENSLSKSGVELQLRNQVVGEKEKSHQKKDKEATVKEDSSNKYILLPLSAMQNNRVSKNVIKYAHLLINMSPASSEEYSSGNIIDSLFGNQKLKEKSTEENKEEFINTGDNKSFLLEQQHEAPELKCNVQRSSQQYKAINRDSRSSKENVNENKCLISKVLDGSSYICVKDYTDIMNRVQISDPFCSLKLPSEKCINNIIQEDVIGSYGENELADVKNIESVPPNSIKYDFLIHNKELNKGVITKKGMNKSSQKRAKELTRFSQYVSEPSEGKQGCDKQDTEKKSNKQTNENLPNIFRKEVLSPMAAPQEVFQSEKEFSGYAKHTSYDSVTYGVKIKDSQDPPSEESNEEEHISKTIEDFDNAQVSVSSLTAKFINAHGPQEQMISSYPGFGIFSKKSMHSRQRCVILTYQKEVKQELKGEHEVSSSQPRLSEGENIDIMKLVPDKKCENQIGHGTKKHLMVALETEKFQNSAQHKQIYGIQNTEYTKSEYQQTNVYATPKLPGLTSQKITEDSLVTTTYNSLFQKQCGLAVSSTSENSALHTEEQNKIFNSDHNVKPSKPFSHDIPHHLEAVDHSMDHILPHTKDGLDTHHLTIDSDDETFAQFRIALLPKNLDHAEKIAYSENSRDIQEKGLKDLESEKVTEHKNIHSRKDKTGEGGNIVGQTSWFFGELFQNKHIKDSTKNEDSQHIIVTQIKTKRHESDVVGNDSEQDKSDVQDTKNIYYLDHVKIIEQESQGEIYNPTQKKSIITDSRNDDQKNDTSVIQEEESVFCVSVQNGKVITDTEWDLKETSVFRGFWEHYLNLVEESRRILQANICERHELQQLEYEFEKLHHDITTFPCEDIYRERKHVAISMADANKLNIGHEECLKEKMKLLQELQGLVLDTRNLCEVQKTESDKELNSGQHSETNNIPPVNSDKKIHTPVKNGQQRLDLKEKLTRKNLMTQNFTISNEKEWLFQIILHLNDFCTLITSGFSAMTSTSVQNLSTFKSGQMDQSRSTLTAFSAAIPFFPMNKLLGKNVFESLQ